MPEAAKPKTAPKTKAAEKTGEEGKEETKAPSNRTNFSKLYPENAPLKLLVDKNPKKAGSKSAERFEGYTGAETVGDALAKGVTYQDIAYDIGHGFIEVDTSAVADAA